MGRPKKRKDADPPKPAKAKQTAPPPEDEYRPKTIDKKRNINIQTGEWSYFKNGVGFTKSKFRATFADDPDGCVGHGMTKDEAIATLWYYENL